MAIILASSFIVAKLVDVFLSSDAGKQALRGVGFESLLTQEGAETAKRYSKAAAGLLVGTALTLRAAHQDQHEGEEGGLIRNAENAAEVAMAAGALAKIVSDFLREEQGIRRAKAAF